MIRQAAFEKKHTLLKGGLHCHTTRSDGACTPEEVMRIHKENGYDFLAITDHRRYNFKDYAPELGLTILPGMEFDNEILTLPCDHGFRTFHTVCLGPKKEEGNPYEQDTLLESARVLDQDGYQPFLDELHKNHNLTVYCHPEWSGTPARYFDRMQGNFAMEIWNSSSALSYDMDTDAAYWDELLGMGIRIFGVATDDGHAAWEHCHGWVMVNAENNVNDILRALAEGAFYSSTGPEIHDFYVEGEKIVVDCSPVDKIRLHSDAHPTCIVRNKEGKITHAEFAIKQWFGPYAYVRASVVDGDKKAWTNPIFFKD